MAFEIRPTEDLVRIMAAGGGFRINAEARASSDLVRIATAAVKGGGQLALIGMNTRRIEDIVDIALAGKGHVSFED